MFDELTRPVASERSLFDGRELTAVPLASYMARIAGRD
jgi:hypothetical protein